MAGKSVGVKPIWAASARREAVLRAHPRLLELEERVAQALERYAFDRVNQREVDDAIAVRSAYLKQNGIPANYAEPEWKCERCQDEGYLGGAVCVCRQQAELETLVKGSGLPAKLREQTFDKFLLKWYSATRKTPLGLTERECAAYALKCCQNFVASMLEGVSRRGLFISGEVGLGKTFLLSAMCNSLIEARVPTMYVVFSDLIAAIKDSFNSDGAQTELRIMTAAKDARVLILDDLGAEQVTEFVTNRLFDIVNYRCNHDKPLVVSSNLSSQDIGRLYGMRIASRLWEMCELVRLYGEDVRWQKQRQV